LINSNERNGKTFRLPFMVTPELKSCVGMLLTLLCATSLYAQEPQSPGDPQELVRAVVANELQALRGDASRWRFVSQAQQAGSDQTKEVIETNVGALTRLVAERGEPLTPEQQRNQDQRLEQFIRNPSELKRQKQEQERDKQRVQKLLAMLPEGFLYQYNWSEGENPGLSFRPNPGFHPPSRDAEVFHAMEGDMIVDGHAKRFRKLRGRLVRDVVFGWGILGQLHRGGVFEVHQDEVAIGHWELTLLAVHITGKALFFKTIRQQQHEERTKFQEAPPNLTPTQAMEMLKEK
jgi:hypothetical protein